MQFSPLARALVMAAIATASHALAADIVLTPPAGGGVTITNAAGNVTRLRVDDATVTLPALVAAPSPFSGLCVESATGRVGTCSIGGITSLVAGTGLTGGTITTTGTVAIATSFQLPQACTNGQVAQSNGAGAWACATVTTTGGGVSGVTASAPLASSGGTAPNISLTGAIPVANGGTGATTLAANGVLFGQGTGAVGTAVGTTGQVLAGNTGAAPAWTDSPSLNGNLVLGNSTATAGNIMKGVARFIHDFGLNNTFIGSSVGNFAMTGQNNTATGVEALVFNTTGSFNTAIGAFALRLNTTGGFNAAIGNQALSQNQTGISNTASGANALLGNETGNDNTAVGRSSLFSNKNGNDNTASGSLALLSNTTGNKNTASGSSSLQLNTAGNNNAALGFEALKNSTGTDNIAIGASAGVNLTTGSGNVAIAAAGVAAESNTIRIGSNGVQSRVFLAGIRGVTTGSANAIAVLIDTNGQLGTVSSSRRFKDDIADMDSSSSALMKLRPVTFHYKTDQNPSGRRLQYGLIAEEVADVYPGLVAYSKDGQIETVMYQYLPSMLLNEYQNQQRTIQAQAAESVRQAALLTKQTDRIAELERERLTQTAEIAGLKQAVAKVAELEQKMTHMARLLDRLDRSPLVNTAAR